MTQIRLHFCGVGEGRTETSAALMWPWFKTRPITFRPLIPQKVVDDVLHLIFNSNKPVVMFWKEGDASGNLQQMVRFGYLKRLGFLIFPQVVFVRFKRLYNPYTLALLVWVWMPPFIFSLHVSMRRRGISLLLINF